LPVDIHGSKLERSFYTSRDALTAARDLLGKTLVVPVSSGVRVSGRIVETEAYCGVEDRAAHSYGGRLTDRTRVMFGPGGFSYVFFVYGMYNQFNVVTSDEGVPHVVLIRALEPVENIEAMRERRGKMPDLNLTSGPGKLCIAMGIDKRLYGADLTGKRVWIEHADRVNDDEVVVTERIGIDYAGEDALKPWRFYIRSSPYVSRRTKERTEKRS